MVHAGFLLPMSVLHLQVDSSGITDVPGFEAAGEYCDIRCNGEDRRDIALIFSPVPCSAAGVFTLNDVKAAPVRLCQQHLQQASAFHGIVINSGNANTCNGEQGLQDAATMAAEAAKRLNVPAASLFVCSTGRIGTLLPMDRVKAGITKVCNHKGPDPVQGHHAAEAILTSDTETKTVTLTGQWQGNPFTVAGIAKGAGMIEPRMATMLAFLASDVMIAPSLLQAILTSSVERSFNRISIDGDMSTNDTVLFLANGCSKLSVTLKEPELLEQFSIAVHQVCYLLAEKIVADGEYRTKVVELRVKGASSVRAAERVARTIANSLLVKTSWYGNDPNWGRLVDAAGYAQIGLREDRLDLCYDSIAVIQAGQPILENAPYWEKIVSRPRFTITLNLHLGNSTYQLLTTDLSEGYINFNKDESTA